MASYDILIKSGLVLDGTGNNPSIGSVGIKGNHIADVGLLENGAAPLIIDARGKYITPGFIDITNHSDTHLTIFKYPELSSLIMQGITTIIGGNCGASLAPLGSHDAIGGIRKWVDPSEINVNWTNIEEFLDTIEKLRPAVNFGTFIGYGTLRRSVIGNQIRLLTAEEREKIKLLIHDGLEQGAFGVSLGLAYGHERISSPDEIIEVCRTLSDYNGTIKIHLRSEGKGLLASINEAINISRETGASVQISHLKAIGKKVWRDLPRALKLIEDANSSGANINFDVSPYHTTGSPLYLLIPAWAREGGFNDLFKRINNPNDKSKIIDDLKNYTLHYDKIMIISAKIPGLAGHTLAEIANRSKLEPEEMLVEALRANEGQIKIMGQTISKNNIELEIKNKNSFIASDGVGYDQEELRSGNLVHPRSFGTFPHFWHRYVNDYKTLLPAEAIQKITSGPANKLGIKNRGILAKGAFADIIVFDPNLFHDRASIKNPFRYPAGLGWVIINGKIAVEEGKFLGSREGKVLKRTQ